MVNGETLSELGLLGIFNIFFLHDLLLTIEVSFLPFRFLYKKEIPPQVTGSHSNRQSNRRDQVGIA